MVTAAWFGPREYERELDKALRVDLATAPDRELKRINDRSGLWVKYLPERWREATDLADRAREERGRRLEAGTPMPTTSVIRGGQKARGASN